MVTSLGDIVEIDRHPLADSAYRAACQRTLDASGVLVLDGFLVSAAVTSIVDEGERNEGLAYFTRDRHNVYLAKPDPQFPASHPRNREVTSSKGCITTDQIPADSALRALYDERVFRDFLCAVLDEDELFEYADPLSSINLHYARAGQELGWHFDNSSFAITLMIQPAESGGVFEYVKDVRDADAGEMNYEMAGRVLDGEAATKALQMHAGTLVLFRGRNAMHRVTPVTGERTRMLAVLAYNTESGVALSEEARLTFFGRLE